MNTPRRRMRLLRTRVALLVLALPFLAGLGARSVAAQAAIPASLLKRLGEAVDGYRTGGSLFVVADSQLPHAVRGVFPTRTDAIEAARRAGRTYGVFGPFYALPDPGIEPPRFNVWVHPPWSYGDTLPEFPRERVPISNVRDVVITINRTDGPPLTRAYAPSDVDAVFFTASALDKFVFSYYARVDGVTAAAQRRAAYLRNIPR